jgi:hypothetical protein
VTINTRSVSEVCKNPVLALIAAVLDAGAALVFSIVLQITTCCLHRKSCCSVVMIATDTQAQHTLVHAVSTR